MENRTLFDFDVDITQVLLAHYHSIPPSGHITTYRNGRPFHGIICILSGSAQYHFTGRTPILLKQGDIAFIPASTSYEVYCTDNQPLDHYTINFFAQKDTFPHWLPTDDMCLLHSSNYILYTKQLQEIVTLWNQRKIGYRMKVRANLLNFLADFLSEVLTQKLNPSSYHRLAPAIKILEVQYTEKITLEQLAASCHMSLSNFRRTFTEAYQQSPISYLTKLRLEKARELLFLGYSIEETAALTGFTDTNYFIRCFKKNIGMTPGQFRSQL